MIQNQSTQNAKGAGLEKFVNLENSRLESRTTIERKEYRIKLEVCEFVTFDTLLDGFLDACRGAGFTPPEISY